jgi:hypothetical protein
MLISPRLVLHRFPAMARIQQSGFKSTGDISERRAPPTSTSPAQARVSSDQEMLSPLSSPGSSPVASRPAEEESEEEEAALPQEVCIPRLSSMLYVIMRFQWCYSCVDGGDLIICDFCDRAMCTTRCLGLPDKLTFKTLTRRGIYFICPTCHNDYYRGKLAPPTPYRVCSLSVFD